MLLTWRMWSIVVCGGVLCAGWLAATPAASIPPPSTAQPPVPRFSNADRERRLSETGLTAGSPVMIRIFKKESVLELWMQTGEQFELFRTYRICSWSGKLGPKQREGDRQAPEGFYGVDVQQLRLTGRNARSFYIDFPNVLDRTLARTGSAIMVHGRCTSIGCFAMTNAAMEEIYTLVERALHEGQDRIEVHAFPFRMTAANMTAHAKSEWHGYWQNLKQGYDVFEETRIPPRISVCGRKYVVDSRSPGHTAMSPSAVPTPVGEMCEDDPGDAPAGLSAQADAPSAIVRVGPKVSAGRNERKAYSAARQGRMAAHARRTRTSDVGSKTRRQ
jgi:murein L,D-transpeptidase YafK